MNDEHNLKIPLNDDWEMSNNLPPTQTNPPDNNTAEDWAITEPLKKIPQKTSEIKADKWQMPEPTFRVSSGTLPEDFLEKAKLPSPIKAENLVMSEKSGIAENPPNLAIEPQPDISEAFSVAETHLEPIVVKPQKSKALKIFLAVFGIFLMLAFAVGFLVLVYFLFFAQKATE